MSLIKTLFPVSALIFSLVSKTIGVAEENFSPLQQETLQQIDDYDDYLHSEEGLYFLKLIQEAKAFPFGSSLSHSFQKQLKELYNSALKIDCNPLQINKKHYPQKIVLHGYHHKCPNSQHEINKEKLNSKKEYRTLLLEGLPSLHQTKSNTFHMIEEPIIYWGSALLENSYFEELYSTDLKGESPIKIERALHSASLIVDFITNEEQASYTWLEEIKSNPYFKEQNEILLILQKIREASLHPSFDQNQEVINLAFLIQDTLNPEWSYQLAQSFINCCAKTNTALSEQAKKFLNNRPESLNGKENFEYFTIHLRNIIFAEKIAQSFCQPSRSKELHVYIGTMHLQPTQQLLKNSFQSLNLMIPIDIQEESDVFEHFSKSEKVQHISQQ